MAFSEEYYPENCLDMELVLVSDSGYPIEAFSKDHNLFVPAVLISGNEKVAVLYYFSETGVSGHRDVEIFLNRYSARKTNGIYTLYASSAKYPEYTFLRDIINIPSVMNYATYVWNGRHFFHFVFRHEYLPELSQVLLSAGNSTGVHVYRLGKNNQMRQILKWIDERIKLYEVSVETIPPQTELEPDNNPLGPQWTREIKCRSFDDYIRAVYCSPNPRISDKAIRVTDNIFELETRNELLSYLASKEGNMVIPAFRRVQTLENGKFTISMILPEAYVSEYLRKIARASRMFNSWRIFLQTVKPFSSHS